MKKNIIAVSFLSLSLFLLVGAGCASNKNNQENENKNGGEGARENNLQPGEQRIVMDDRFTTGTLESLELNQTIMVIGSENSDGSILANQIMIGGGQIDFDNIIGTSSRSNFINKEEMNGDENTQNMQGSDRDFQNERPDFMNMSEEERQNFREEMSANGGGDRAVFTEGATRQRQSAMRLVGEIIEMDQHNITLKVEGGGSKLIFISEKTLFLISKEVDNNQVK